MTSNINPNNIDGQYPVAGQDNNSQGFRDNFTNTKTNFAYAAAEITDLQNKAVLKSALTGGTLNNNMNGSILSNAQLQQMSGTVVALGTVSGSFTVDYSAGPYQTVTTAAPVSLDFSNFTAAGTQDYVVLQITISDVTHTLQLPSAVGYSDSATSEIGIQGLDTMTNTITFSATGTYLYSFTTADGGTTVYINDLTQARTGFTGNVSVVGNLSVTGTIVGNIEINNIESIVGNVTAGNLLTGGLVSATANITGGNLLTGGLVSAAGNVTGGNIFSDARMSSAGNVIGGNILTAGLISAAGNVTAGNLITGNISLVGSIISTLNVTGNITGANISSSGELSAAGNVLASGFVSTAGNVVGANVVTTGLVSATGNVIGGNIVTTGSISATGNISGGNSIISGASYPALGLHVTGGYVGANTDGITIDYVTGNGRISVGPSDGVVFYTGNVGNTALASISSTGIISAAGNVTGTNILTAGLMSATGNVTAGNIAANGSSTANISVIVPVRANITATGTYSLSTTNSINILVANNTGYTATLNMPTSPVNGQICNFAISGNTVTLAVGTGTVSPTFAGSTTAGTGYRYCYYTTDATWYRIG